MHASSRALTTTTILAALSLLVACGQQEPVLPDGAKITIETLSNRADLISGGDALLAIHLPEALASDTLSVTVDGRDVSEQFAVRADGRITGLVGELVEGDNQVLVEAGQLAATLTLTNHDRGGPIFSGPQIQPWVCATPTARDGDADAPATYASGLSREPENDKCHIPAEISYHYRTVEDCGRDPENPRVVRPCFKPYDLEGGVPADLATTTDQEGETIPFIVRVERGTINRGIYDIAVVAKPGSDWSPFAQESTWNGKLVHTFGGSTGTPRRQMPPNSSWQQDEELSRGFMVSVSSLTDQALNANKVVAAETVMMLKEHIGDTYGEVQHTIGSGCSGGSIMQLVIAGTYPGVLDGIQPACTYPDSHTTSIEISDCVLLGNYFESEEFAALAGDLDEAAINAKKAAIAGHMNEQACSAWSRSFGHSNNPGNFERRGESVNNCMLPESWVYDAQSKPDGIRCSQPDHEIALWGKAPGKDYGRRFTDNTGVQYGLDALREGAISAEEFVTLNENIGGSDIDRGLTSERMQADPETMALAYRMGLVTDPRQWAKTPIIDLRGNDNSGIHMNWRAFAVRDRLNRVLGHHENQVIWRFGPGLLPPKGSNLTPQSLETMDAWLTAIEADNSDLSRAQKVISNKPKNAFDFCLIGDDVTTKVRDQAQCDADPTLAYYQSPRQVAGGPLAENILKCELKPLNRDDYGPEFSDEQWQRLQATFEEGVCDWSKPGVGMQPSVPWLDYSYGPGGEPLPEAPKSVASP